MLQGAGDGIRTHDNHLGKVALYQLSYTRLNGERCRIRGNGKPGP